MKRWDARGFDAGTGGAPDENHTGRYRPAGRRRKQAFHTHARSLRGGYGRAVADYLRAGARAIAFPLEEHSVGKSATRRAGAFLSRGGRARGQQCSQLGCVCCSRKKVATARWGCTRVRGFTPGLSDGGERAELALAPDRFAYVHVLRGSVSVNGTPFGEGDGARVRKRRSIKRSSVLRHVEGPHRHRRRRRLRETGSGTIRAGSGMCMKGRSRFRRGRVTGRNREPEFAVATRRQAEAFLYPPGPTFPVPELPQASWKSHSRSWTRSRRQARRYRRRNAPCRHSRRTQRTPRRFQPDRY